MRIAWYMWSKMEDRYSNIDALRQTKNIMCKDVCQPQIHKLWWHIFPIIWSSAATDKLLQSCQTLCDRMDHNLPGSTAHGILQARILQWVAMTLSRGSSQPRDWTCISCLLQRVGRFFTTSATWEVQVLDGIILMHIFDQRWIYLSIYIFMYIHT